jgi:putative ABC transport system permease protein
VVYTSLARRVFLPDEEGPTELFILQLSRAGFAGFRFKDAAPDSAWQEFEQGGAVIVTEPYAYRHGLQRGSTLRLRTDRGEREFPVAGVYYDYGSDQGRVTISRATFDRFWDDRSVDSLGIFVAPGADPAVVADRLRERSAGRQQVVVYPNRELYQASLATFDRTFAITGVLRLLAVLVAFVGILNALMAIQIERSRELAVLRATGLTPRQLWGLVAGETGLIGLIAGLLALPLGVLQALVLIHVINRRSFGWTMATEIAPAILLQALALALAAALLAGCWPAARMAATPPALALREE